MNIRNARKGVRVRSQTGLTTIAANLPPVPLQFLMARRSHEGQEGVITKGREEPGEIIWVQFDDGIKGAYWFSELDEVDPNPTQVPEDTGWDDFPLGPVRNAYPARPESRMEREDKMLDIHIHDFVRRQTPDSRFSHWLLSDEDLIDRIREGWDKATQGYRDGVMLVPVDPEGFFTGIVTLQEGDKLRGAFVPRQKGEEPRRQVSLDSGVEGGVASRKPPAVSVEIVLYRDDVLSEDGDQTGHEWNVISVNANPVEGSVPMSPGTLMANHFHDSGGTQTGMSDEEFVDALREAYFFWKDKSFIG